VAGFGDQHRSAASSIITTHAASRRRAVTDPTLGVVSIGRPGLAEPNGTDPPTRLDRTDEGLGLRSPL